MDGWPKPVTLPRAEPIDVEEAKDHVRQSHSADDTYIGVLISVARKRVEKVTGQALVLQTWDYALDGFPDGERLDLPRPPVRAVDSVTYHDDDLSTSTVLSSDNYQVDTLKTPGAIVLKYGETWPSDVLRQSSGVVVRFKAGYEVPFTVAADTDILTATDHWFSDGDVVRVRVSGGESGALPTGLDAETDYYVRDVSGHTLKLATESGGSAVDITDTGTGTLFIGPEPVPEDLRQYMLLLIGAMYEHREMDVTGAIVSQLKFAQHLLDPHRLWMR